MQAYLYAYRYGGLHPNVGHQNEYRCDLRDRTNLCNSLHVKHHYGRTNRCVCQHEKRRYDPCGRTSLGGDWQHLSNLNEYRCEYHCGRTSLGGQRYPSNLCAGCPCGRTSLGGDWRYLTNRNMYYQSNPSAQKDTNQYAGDLQYQYGQNAHY